MNGLARLAAALPYGNAPYPTPAPSCPDAVLREVLGGPLEGRLAAAAELRDDAAVDRLLDRLLDHPYLGRRLAGRVIVRTGEALAASGGATP